MTKVFTKLSNEIYDLPKIHIFHLTTNTSRHAGIHWITHRSVGASTDRRFGSYHYAVRVSRTVLVQTTKVLTPRSMITIFIT